MKLASYKSGRDGRLMVVSTDLSRTAPCETVSTMQALLDEWDSLHQLVEKESDDLNASSEGEGFDQTKCASPLPRAYQWADGSAYVNHVELVRKARGAEMPESFWADPLMYQGGSDSFIGPREDVVFTDSSHGLDMEAEVAVITGDVAMGASVEMTEAAIKLVMLVNDVSLRGLIPNELGKGFGFFQSKPSSAFSPVAVTIDELGAAWSGGKLSGTVLVDLNGQPLGRANAGVDMTFNFPTLVSHAAKTRDLCAGSIVGSGTVSNRDKDGGPGKPVSQGGLGYSCLAEVRMIETIANGAPETPFMRDGDTVRIEMLDENGGSIFGAIDQKAVLK